MNRRHFLCSSLASLAAAQTPRPGIRILPIEFGSHKQVFIDWHFVEAGYGLAFTFTQQQTSRNRPNMMPYGVKLAVYPPILPTEPALKPDVPSDGILTGGYSTLLKDGGKYRIWYESYETVTSDDEAKVCYAESDDGVAWRKPNLGLIDYHGTKSNNIVYLAGHGGSVFIDPSAPAAERYKFIHADRAPLQEIGGFQINSMVYGAVSPDGLSWRRIKEPILRHTSDTQTVGTWDPVARKYVAYVRGWEPRTRAGYGGRRVVMRTESSDFRSFPEPRTVFAFGPGDPPDADIYTNAYQRWPGATNAHVLMPAIYHRASDYVDLQVATSRDGIRWERPYRTTWVPVGEPGSGYEGSLYAGIGLTPAGAGRWVFPLTRYSLSHNENWPQHYHGKRHGNIWLANLREDGLMALEAESRGECWTQPATFTGSRLLVNSWGKMGGRVEVELADHDGKPYPGFSLAECDGLEGDQLWQPVRWKGNPNVGEFAGKLVRLRFGLTRARLHAFRFSV